MRHSVCCLSLMPHFFVAQFSQCPIFRCPFFSFPFPLAFMRFTVVFNFLYMAVVRFVALCIVAHFCIAQIYLCRFFRGYIDVAFFRCRIFSLSNLPIAQFSADFFQLPFSVEVFAFYRCCYVLLHRCYAFFALFTVAHFSVAENF